MLLQRRKISWREKAGDPQFDGKAKIVWQTREELIEFLCKRFCCVNVLLECRTELKDDHGHSALIGP